MPKISIATSEDLNELSPLLNLLMAQEADFKPDLEAQERGLKMIIESPKIGIILKLEYEGKIVGMINLLVKISTVLGAKVAIFEDFIIAPYYRNKCYGKLLFKEALKQAKAINCQSVTLLTDKDNVNAHRFYKAQGMEASAMLPFRKML
jgi:predicted acetyltransferase